MKRVIYSLIALTLILSACGGAGEPKKTGDVEPYTQISVVPREELSTLIYTYPLYSLKKGEVKDSYKFLASSVEAKEEKSETQMVTAKPATEVKPKVTPKIQKASTNTVGASNDELKGKKRTFTLTAYTAGYESTGKRKGDKDYGITSSGTTVKEGRTAACPKSYPSGTKIYIPSLDNTYTCEDTGSAITEGKLDIYIEDLDVALEFGRKKNVVGYVLKNNKGL